MEADGKIITFRTKGLQQNGECFNTAESLVVVGGLSVAEITGWTHTRAAKRSANALSSLKAVRSVKWLAIEN